MPLRGRVISDGETPASTGNIANIITVVRILMAPVFIWLLLADDSAEGVLRYVAAVLFVVAILTDSVDGFLARRLNLVTDFGKLVDPIADKVLTGGALVALSILGEVPWWVTGLILLREVGITVWRMVIVNTRVVPASRGGKIKTWLQSIAIAFALVPLWTFLGDRVNLVNAILIGAALAATVVTGVDYLWQAWRLRRAARAQTPAA